jgi:hypothetical protein
MAGHLPTCPRWEEVFRAHADRLSYQTTAAFNCRDLYCWRHSIRPAMSSFWRSLFPNPRLGPTPPAWTPRCWASPARERTEIEYQDLLHRAGLALVKTTPTASELSILEATPAEDGQR